MVRLDVERSDYIFRRGRRAELLIGPFGFLVNTADHGQIGFSIAFGRWSWAWTVGHDE